jgi:Tfp pilus assembly protein PilN
MPKKEINLIPKEEFEKKPLGKFLLWLLSVGRWIVIFTELVVILAFISRFKLDRDLTNLYEQIKQKQAIINSYSDFEKEFRSFQEKISKIKELEKDQVKITSIISNISSFTPGDIIFSTLNYEKETKEIKINGLALSEEGLGGFIAGFSNSQEFTDVNLSSISKKPEEIGIKFSLTAKYLPGGRKQK